MQCKCGFENAADARFCGNCRSALGDAPAAPFPMPLRHQPRRRLRLRPGERQRARFPVRTLRLWPRLWSS